MSIFLNDVEYGGPQPVATTSTLGISKPDGTSLDIDASGTLSVKNVAASKVNYDNTTSQIESTDTQTAIDLLVSKIADLESRLSIAESGLSGVTQRVTTSEGLINTLDGKVSSAESAISTLQSDVSTLDSSVATLDQNVATAQGQITSMETVLNKALIVEDNN